MFKYIIIVQPTIKLPCKKERRESVFDGIKTAIIGSVIPKKAIKHHMPDTSVNIKQVKQRPASTNVTQKTEKRSSKRSQPDIPSKQGLLIL